MGQSEAHAMLKLEFDDFPFDDLIGDSIEELAKLVVLEIAKQTDLKNKIRSFYDGPYQRPSDADYSVQLEREFRDLSFKIFNFYIGIHDIKEVVICEDALKGNLPLHWLHVNTENECMGVYPMSIYKNPRLELVKFSKICSNCNMVYSTWMRGITGRMNRLWYWPFIKQAPYAIICDCHAVIAHEWHRLIDVTGVGHLNDKEGAAAMKEYSRKRGFKC